MYSNTTSTFENQKQAITTEVCSTKRKPDPLDFLFVRKIISLFVHYYCFTFS